MYGCSTLVASLLHNRRNWGFHAPQCCMQCHYGSESRLRFQAVICCTVHGTLVRFCTVSHLMINRRLIEVAMCRKQQDHTDACVSAIPTCSSRYQSRRNLHTGQWQEH
jgi:hypothetical protein